MNEFREHFTTRKSFDDVISLAVNQVCTVAERGREHIQCFRYTGVKGTVVAGVPSTIAVYCQRLWLAI
jgi:hypothetical protein